MRIGEKVRIIRIPPAVAEGSPPETLEIFRKCVGQILQVDGFDENGHLELNVLDDGSQAPNCAHHTIWIEPEFVQEI